MRDAGAVFVRTVVAEGSPRRLVGVVMVLFLLLAGAVYGAARDPAPRSLRGAVASAEQETRGLYAKIRAIRGTDFAAIAQQNQGAVGLITVSFGKDYYNGTGFVITPDGYMLTVPRPGRLSRRHSVRRDDDRPVVWKSGSPLYNANGEVIAIHRAGLAQAPGFAFSVPTRHVVAIMPVPLRPKLGIE